LRFLRSADSITDTSVALPSQSQSTSPPPAPTFGLLAWIQLPLIFLNRSRLFPNQDRILSRHELCLG
jgi:hypothetical protein